MKLTQSDLKNFFHPRSIAIVGASTGGLPTRKRLDEIGLHDVAEDLAMHNSLSDEQRPSVSELLKNSGDTIG